MIATPDPQHAAGAARCSCEKCLATLRRAVAAGAGAREQLNLLEQLHDELRELAVDAHREARSDLERHRDRLAEYDAESERLLAETGGRVRAVQARLAHARNGHGPGAPTPAADLAIMEAEIHAARQQDDQRVAERLAGREWIARECRAARAAVLQAGTALLSLSQPIVPSLHAIQRAGANAADRLAPPPAAPGGADLTGPLAGAEVHGSRNGGPAACN